MKELKKSKKNKKLLNVLMPRFSGYELEGENYKMHLIFVFKNDPFCKNTFV
jgi:hypothetical protein